MNSFKILIGFVFLALTTFSCDPQDLPQPVDTNMINSENITADTKNQEDEDIGHKENTDNQQKK